MCFPIVDDHTNFPDYDKMNAFFNITSVSPYLAVYTGPPFANA